MTRRTHSVAALILLLLASGCSIWKERRQGRIKEIMDNHKAKWDECQAASAQTQEEAGSAVAAILRGDWNEAGAFAQGLNERTPRDSLCLNEWKLEVLEELQAAGLADAHTLEKPWGDWIKAHSVVKTGP